MEQAAPNSGMSVFFELAAKTVMDMVRFMHRPPQGITAAGPSSPISKVNKRRRAGRRTFLQRILRTARRYAVEYIRMPAATNIIGLIKVKFFYSVDGSISYERCSLLLQSQHRRQLKSYRSWSWSSPDFGMRSTA